MKKRKPLLWTLRRTKKRLPALIILIIINIGLSFLHVAFALCMKNVIDSAVNGAANGNREQFIQACIIQGSVVLGLLLGGMLSRHIREKLLLQLDRDWKIYLFHGTLHGEYEDVSKYHTGELLNLFNNDTKTIDDALISIFPGLASMVAQLVAAIAALIVMAPKLTAVILVGGVCLIFATSMIRKPLKRLHKRISEENGKISGFLQEILEKLLMVQAMDVSQEIEKRSHTMLNRRYNLERKRKNISMFSSSCLNFLAMGASFVVLTWGAFGIYNGVMSYGTLSALIQLVNQVRTPMVNLSGVFPKYLAMTAAAERLMDMEEIFGEPAEPADTPENLYERMQTIRAENISFAYDRDPIFQNASFDIPKGEFGVIIGHSGIGKSTLLKLMLGIFKLQEGSLSIQTVEGPLSLDRTTRGLFAYVPQGNLLISGTLRDNLTITRPEATQEEIDQAVYISCMDDYLGSLPMGLETVLGEGAQGLSEGQAQRLSIARAVLSQAPVMLLDEATSALDPVTEQVVLERLQAAGKTCIAVTHRPAAVEMSQWQLEVRKDGCTLHCQKNGANQDHP